MNFHNNILDWHNNNQGLITEEPHINLNVLDNTHPLNTVILEDEVKHYITRLKHKSPGPTNITKDIISHLPRNIIAYITNLYNASLASGHFPKLFKEAHIILIKKPNKNPKRPDSYRSIALLELLGKIFEFIFTS